MHNNLPAEKSLCPQRVKRQPAVLQIESIPLKAKRPVLDVPQKPILERLTSHQPMHHKMQSKPSKKPSPQRESPTPAPAPARASIPAPPHASDLKDFLTELEKLKAELSDYRQTSDRALNCEVEKSKSDMSVLSALLEGPLNKRKKEKQQDTVPVHTTSMDLAHQPVEQAECMASSLQPMHTMVPVPMLCSDLCRAQECHRPCASRSGTCRMHPSRMVTCTKAHAKNCTRHLRQYRAPAHNAHDNTRHLRQREAPAHMAPSGFFSWVKGRHGHKSLLA